METLELVGGEQAARSVGELLSRHLVTRALRNEVLNEMVAQTHEWRLQPGFGSASLFFPAPLQGVDTRGVTPSTKATLDWREERARELESKLMGADSAASQIHGLGATMTTVDNRITPAVAEYKKKRAAEFSDRSGRGWFDLKGFEMTREAKADLRLLRMRNYFAAPGQHFRNLPKQLPTFFQFGTVEEDVRDPYHRVARRDRRQTFAEELIRDEKASRRRNRRVSIARGLKDVHGNATPQAQSRKRRFLEKHAKSPKKRKQSSKRG